MRVSAAGGSFGVFNVVFLLQFFFSFTLSTQNLLAQGFPQARAWEERWISGGTFTGTSLTSEGTSSRSAAATGDRCERHGVGQEMRGEGKGGGG